MQGKCWSHDEFNNYICHGIPMSFLKSRLAVVFGSEKEECAGMQLVQHNLTSRKRQMAGLSGIVFEEEMTYVWTDVMWEDMANPG